MFCFIYHASLNSLTWLMHLLVLCLSTIHFDTQNSHYLARVCWVQATKTELTHLYGIWQILSFIVIYLPIFLLLQQDTYPHLLGALLSAQRLHVFNNFASCLFSQIASSGHLFVIFIVQICLPILLYLLILCNVLFI